MGLNDVSEYVIVEFGNVTGSNNQTTDYIDGNTKPERIVADYLKKRDMR